MATTCKRVIQLSANTSSLHFSRFRRVNPSNVLHNHFYGSPSTNISANANRIDCRQISQFVKPSNPNRAFLVDTLALVRSLEVQGVPSKQAEAITVDITEVLTDSLENVSNSFVSTAEMQKAEMLQESNLHKFKAEVKSSRVDRMWSLKMDDG